MSRALIFAVILGMATAVEVEWKGIFYTPEATYKWGAQKVGGAYADPAMKMVLIAVPNASNALASQSSFSAALTSADTKGTSALAGSCTDVQDGGVMTPMAEGNCYNLVFDDSKSQTIYDIDATGVAAIAFFAQHLPTEFEEDEHYLKDTSGADIEPMAQDPEGGGHDHGAFPDEFEGKCVCQAKKHGWQLDCSKKDKIQDAVAALQANSACKAKGAPETCVDNYYVMQAHHDHCLHHDLPTGIENALHDYEDFYDDCFIKRQFDPDLLACPAEDCTDSTKMTTAIATLQAGCGKTNATSCTDVGCAAAIKTVLMVHDTCNEDQLPNNLEYALHSYEEPCAAQLCNSAPAAFDPYADPCMARVSAASGFGSQVAFWMTMSAFWMLTSL